MNFTFINTYLNNIVGIISLLLILVVLFSYFADRDKAKLRYVGLIYAATIAIMVTLGLVEFFIVYLMYGRQGHY